MLKEIWWKKYNISDEALLTAKNHLMEATNLLKECATGVK